MENISNATPSMPAQSTRAHARGHRIITWASLLLLVLAGLAVVLIPAMLIYPFRPQSARDLELSFALRRWSPILTILFSLVALWLVIRLWPAGRWWRKSALVLLMLFSLATVWLARQNHFEWMFNPLAHTSYARADEAASFVQDSDMLMTVKINGEAAAYPIRQMAYHHLVQDTVGGTPIVATY